MNEDRLRRMLRESPIEDRDSAEERAWRVLRAAFEDRTEAPAPAPFRRARIAVAAIAAVVLAAALALTPAGAKVGDLIGDVFESARDDAKPALTELPGGGRLLVESQRGPWIVEANGSRRLLGEYDGAAWSPRGLFVAATSDRELAAVVADAEAVGEPAGTVRWTLSRPGRISDPAWVGPSVASRIAYRSGESLRVVAGDGTDDRLVDDRAAGIPAVWKPGRRHLLTYVDHAGGRVRVVDVDSGERLWQSGRYGVGIVGLDWSPDGRRLFVLTTTFFSVLDERGHVVARSATKGNTTQAAISPRSGEIALIRSVADARIGRSELVLVDRDGIGERRLFSGPGRFTDVAWSPDGKWLLAAWRDADQWLFIRPDDEKPVAVSNISRQFDPGGSDDAAFPRIAGWCCAR